MDVHGVKDRTLGRLAATLVALAVLAEQAGGRSYPVRCLVLFILRRAESVAYAFVAAMPTTRTVVFVRIPTIPNSPDDATGLAMRFRALAAALDALLRLARLFADVHSRCSVRRCGRRLGALPIALDDWTPRPNDTS